MTGNKRKRGLDRPIAVCGVQIGVANSAASVLTTKSPVPGWGGPTREAQAASEMLNHGCVHLSVP